MKTAINKFKRVSYILIIALTSVMLLSSCARYAKNVNALYEPTATVRGGSGEVYIVIPESQITQSTDIKWVLGKVKDDEGKEIDEVFSPRSPAELIQAAFVQEFMKTGYTTIAATKRNESDNMVIDLTKTEVKIEQISDVADLKATCRVVVGVDVFKKGQLIKRLQYESTSSKTDIRDRDLLAKKVLMDALKSAMNTAIPELQGFLNRQ